jgi:hypothetical protein
MYICVLILVYVLLYMCGSAGRIGNMSGKMSGGGLRIAAEETQTQAGMRDGCTRAPAATAQQQSSSCNRAAGMRDTCTDEITENDLLNINAVCGADAGAASAPDAVGAGVPLVLARARFFFSAWTSSLRPHTLVARSLWPQTLVASTLRPQTLVVP